MPFEFKIKRKQVFTQTEVCGLCRSDLITKLSEHLQYQEKLDIQQEGNRIVCHSNKSILYYNYKSVFTIEKGENVVVWYEYNLISVFKITVIMILFAAFFSKFSFNSLLIFSGIFIVVFFAFNIIYINSVLKNMILNTFIPDRLNVDEKLTEEQKEWIRNPKKCPACGEEISDYNFICPECGISINKRNRTKNINLSDFFDVKFKYKYVKKVKGQKKS